MTYRTTATVERYNTAVTTKPILWFVNPSDESKDFLDHWSFDSKINSELSGVYQLIEASAKNIDQYEGSDSSECIILIDNNTDDAELLVKDIGWQIRSTHTNHPEIYIVTLQFPISTYSTANLAYAIEGNESKFIPSGKVSFNDYCNQCTEEIDPSKINKYIELIYKHIPKEDREDELELIKQRCHYKYKHKEFRDKCMSLELKFQQELHKRGVVYNNPSLIDDEREELKERIENDYSVSVVDDLDLYRYLPETLAKDVTQWCEFIGIRKAVALNALITGISSLHPIGTDITLHNALNFKQVPYLYSILVAPSGQKKTPLLNTLIKEPLSKLQAIANEKYKIALEQYKKDLAAYKKDSENLPEPIKPYRRRYYSNNFTNEGLVKSFNNRPDDAVLVLSDEIAGLFNSSNQYRGGKGSDKQDMLSYYDGSGCTTLRADSDKEVNVEKVGLSIFGGIQPEVLKKHLGNLEDHDGFFARYNFVHQPISIVELPDDDVNFNIVDTIEKYYINVLNLGKQNYILSKEAFKLFKKKHDAIDKSIEKHQNNASLCTILSKVKGRIGRFALNLQAINYAGSNDFSNVVSGEIMQKATELADFYLNEILQFHSEVRASKGNLSDQLQTILKLAQANNNEVSVRDVSRKLSAKKRDVLIMLDELTSMNYGETVTKGNSTKFKLAPDSSDSSDTNDRIQSQTSVQNIKVSDSTPDSTPDISDSRTSELTVIDPPPIPEPPDKPTVGGTVGGTVRAENIPESSETQYSKPTVGTVGTVGDNVGKISDPIADKIITYIRTKAHKQKTTLDALKHNLNINEKKIIDSIYQMIEEGILEKDNYSQMISLKLQQ